MDEWDELRSCLLNQVGSVCLGWITESSEAIALLVYAEVITQLEIESIDLQSSLHNNLLTPD